MEMIRNNRIDFLILNFRKYSNSLSISDEGYSRNVHTKFDIYVFIYTPITHPISVCAKNFFNN